MKKRAIFIGGFVLVAACLLLGVLFFQKRAPAVLPIYEGEAVIEMRPDIFLPAEIRVRRGTRVRFVNHDTVWRWPASDLHPTHDIYSAFDPKQAIGPGEEWSFVFERIGRWGMHDHLSPLIVGEIIVED